MHGNIYRNKKVLVFGNTGFKGSWLSLVLINLGADVYGASEKVLDDPSLYNSLKIQKKIRFTKVDIKNIKKVESLIDYIKPDFIFHLAAQAIVLSSIKNPLNTFESNAIGTLNILEAVRRYNKKIVLVIITSDKCYENMEKKSPYKEHHKLGGKDPYSASKAAAEIIFRSYVESYFKYQKKIKASTARAGNVIAGGDWSPYRLIPDCMKSANLKKRIIIRNSMSTRPWQHVLEPLSGYLTLGQYLFMEEENILNESFNFGSNKFKNVTVKKLIDKMSERWTDIIPNYKNFNNSSESKLLQLDTTKSSRLLNWNSILSLDETVNLTVDWYKFFYEKRISMYDYTLSQINHYYQLLSER